MYVINNSMHGCMDSRISAIKDPDRNTKDQINRKLRIQERIVGMKIHIYKIPYNNHYGGMGITVCYVCR